MIPTTRTQTPCVPNLNDGLAVYSRGEGAPVLLMPSPDGFTFSPDACSPLAELLVGLERRVVTFDPPGAYASTRPAVVSLEELHAAAQEALQFAGLSEPVDVSGYGMGAWAALAFAIHYPQQVKSLALIGALSGRNAIRQYRGLPWYFRRSDPDYWRYTAWERKLSRGQGSLALHKKLLSLIAQHAYFNPDNIPMIQPDPGDEQVPAPVRDRWSQAARGLDYRHAARGIDVPVLLCVGRFDALTPIGCSQELAERIHAAWLMIFENSGHFPQVEEPQPLSAVLADFWRV